MTWKKLLRIVSVYKFRTWHGHDSSRWYPHPKHGYMHSLINFETSTRINTVLVHSFCSRYDRDRSPGAVFTCTSCYIHNTGTFQVFWASTRRNNPKFSQKSLNLYFKVYVLVITMDRQHAFLKTTRQQTIQVLVRRIDWTASTTLIKM